MKTNRKTFNYDFSYRIMVMRMQKTLFDFIDDEELENIKKVPIS